MTKYFVELVDTNSNNNKVVDSFTLAENKRKTKRIAKQFFGAYLRYSYRFIIRITEV
jgi:hypothetical protein